MRMKLGEAMVGDSLITPDELREAREKEEIVGLLLHAAGKVRAGRDVPEKAYGTIRCLPV
ncbi:MAG: hypothetical protein WA610_14390 [Thermodesulfovibrionales bacterium]